MPTINVTTAPTLVPGMAAQGNYDMQCQGASPIHLKVSNAVPQPTDAADVDLECDSLRRSVTQWEVPDNGNVYAWVDAGDSVLAWEEA